MDEIGAASGRSVWPGMGFLVVRSKHSHIIRFLPGNIYVDLVKGNSVPTISKFYLENGKYIPYDPSVAYEFSFGVFSNENLPRNSLSLLKDWNSQVYAGRVTGSRDSAGAAVITRKVGLKTQQQLSRFL